MASSFGSVKGSHRRVCFISRPTGEHTRKLSLSAVRLQERWKTPKPGSLIAPSPKLFCPPSPTLRPRQICQARGISGSFDDVRETVQTAAASVVRTFSNLYRVVWGNGLGRLSVLFALIVALTTAILNTALVGYVNSRILPTVTHEVATLLEREVNIGRVHWVSPVGLLGIAPLTSVGPVKVGPGPVEKTSAEVAVIQAGLDVFQSALQGKFVLWLNCHDPDVDLVQADNFSWFGHPVDTTPSSKDYLPGLTKRNATGAGGQSASSTTRCSAASSLTQPPGQTYKRNDSSFQNSSLDERRRSHYASSTSSASSALDVKSRQGVVKESLPTSFANNRAEQERGLLQVDSSSWHHPISRSDLLEEDHSLVLDGMGGRSLVISVPDWRVSGPQGSVGMKGNGKPVQAYRDSADGKTNKDPGGGGSSAGEDRGKGESSRSTNGKGDSLEGGSGRRGRHRRVAKETSHSGGHTLKSNGREARRESTRGKGVDASTQTGNGVVGQEGGGGASTPPAPDTPQTKEEKICGEEGVATKKAKSSGRKKRAPVAPQAPAQEPEVTVQEIHGPKRGEAKKKRSKPQTEEMKVDVVLPMKGLDLQNGGRGGPAAGGDVTGDEVRQWVGAGLRQLTRELKPPEVAVGKICVKRGLLYVHMSGEPIPRQFVNVDGYITFGSGYRQLSVDAKGQPHARNPDSIKCTMISPGAQRHLRFVTPGVGEGLDRVFPGDITKELLAERSGRHQSDRAAPEPSTTSDMLASSLHTAPVIEKLNQSGSDGRGGGTGHGVGGRRYSSLSMSQQTLKSVLWDVESVGAGVKSSPPKVRAPNDFGPRRMGSRVPTKGPPKGGDVHVTVNVDHLMESDRWPELEVAVYGNDLHAPLIERIIELPMDIHEGRANGHIRIRANDDATWVFPKIDGRVKCSDVDFHFWDAPDHFSKTNLDLIFSEDNRLYFHNATGQYGSVPLSVTGDMDINPETGHYRLSANVPPVEVNAIRAALGARPLPHPVTSAVQGVLHCTGPLEEPVFSGSAVAVRPPDSTINSLEDSHAKSTLLANPQAVGAFDKLAFSSGSAVFTHSMATDVFTLHDSVAKPVGGGKLTGSGQMWVAPPAEKDPEAIAMQMEGYGVITKEIIKSYLPETAELPEVLDPGATNLKATFRGSHISPKLRVRWEAPRVHASGSAEMSREYWKASAQAPTFDVSATLHTSFPDFELTKTAYSQSDMNALTTPSIVGVDADVSMKGCDIMPLMSNTSAVDRVASGQAVRLKLSGRTQVSARRSEEIPESSESAFSGDIHLQGLRVNQLNLARQLGGSLEFSQTGLKLLAKGQRSDELLDIDFKVPREMWMEDNQVADETETPSVEQGKEEEEEERVLTDGQDPTDEGSVEKAESEPEDYGGYFSLRQGKLLISTEIGNLMSRVKMGIRGLKLDDLELASLRGNLQDVALDLNFDSREGRGEINMRSPRYSGLMGEYLSGGVRWEKDVVRLEKMILQQKRSRYEVEGEYSLPPNLALPKSIPGLTQASPVAIGNSWMSGEMLTGTSQPPLGRWRLQVNVPNADVEEIIPAGRLLSRATSLTQRNYDEAKTAFLDGLTSAGISSGRLGEELRKLMMPEADLNYQGDSAEGSAGGALPGLQTLRGKWSGAVQAWGGGGGASTLNVKARGDSWQWGEYELDKAVAVGSYHSSEGIHVEELSLGTGEAQLLIRGDLLGPKQDATIVLNDFPAALLSPIYKAVPALQNAVPAVTDRVSLSRFVDSWDRTTNALGLNFWKEDTPMQRLAKGSPVNGLLYVQGSLGGSAENPEGVVNVQLYDGAVGPTRLSGAKAELTLNDQRQIQFNLSATPDEKPGLVRVSGTLPFLQENGIRGNIDANVKVVDGGMLLMSALVPDFRWENGTADINLSAFGPLSDPQMKGGANIARATIYSPNLKYPLKNVQGVMTIEDGKIAVEKFEAKSGNHGFIHARGFLPMEMGSPRDIWGLFTVDVSGLELKMSNLYNGRLDSSLRITKSLEEPVVSGDIELSRGNLQLQYGALGSSDEKVPGKAHLGMGTFAAEGQTLGLGQELNMMLQQPPELVLENSMAGVHLQNLRLILGSELRFQVPLMVNLAISGSVEVSGGLDPSTIVPSGTIQIDGGMVNLLATQLRMERADQPGRITFIPEQGFDPNVDITFTSTAEGFRAICRGKASTWQENLIVADGTDEVRLSQAAKMFQKRLDDVLVAENGQLAFVNLAASTMATMTPRLDTQGQIGAARWRLVSAPNIPDLLTNADRLDLHNIVTSLITGTEVEVQFGPTVQAVVAHKMRGADYGTQWNLSLNLTENFRLSATVANSPPTTRTLMLEYSSEGRPRLL